MIATGLDLSPIPLSVALSFSLIPPLPSLSLSILMQHFEGFLNPG